MGQQVPFAALHFDNVSGFERVAVRAERNGTFQRGKVLHLADFVPNSGSLGGEFRWITGHVRRLYRVGVNQHDIVGGGIELRRRRAVDAGRLGFADELRLEFLGAVVPKRSSLRLSISAA